MAIFPAPVCECDCCEGAVLTPKFPDPLNIFDLGNWRPPQVAASFTWLDMMRDAGLLRGTAGTAPGATTLPIFQEPIPGGVPPPLAPPPPVSWLPGQAGPPPSSPSGSQIPNIFDHQDFIGPLQRPQSQVPQPIPWNRPDLMAIINRNRAAAGLPPLVRPVHPSTSTLPPAITHGAAPPLYRPPLTSPLPPVSIPGVPEPPFNPYARPTWWEPRYFGPPTPPPFQTLPPPPDPAAAMADTVVIQPPVYPNASAANTMIVPPKIRPATSGLSEWGPIAPGTSGTDGIVRPVPGVRPVYPGQSGTDGIVRPQTRPTSDIIAELNDARSAGNAGAGGTGGRLGRIGRLLGRLGLAATAFQIPYDTVGFIRQWSDRRQIEDVVRLIGEELTAMMTYITNSRATLQDCSQMRADLRQLEAMLRVMVVAWDMMQSQQAMPDDVRNQPILEPGRSSVFGPIPGTTQFRSQLQLIERLRMTINGHCGNVEAAARERAANNTCTVPTLEAIQSTIAGLIAIMNATFAGNADIGRILTSESDGTNPSLGQTVSSAVSSMGAVGAAVAAGTVSNGDAAAALGQLRVQINQACNLRDNQIAATYGPAGDGARDVLRLVRQALRDTIDAAIAAIMRCNPIDLTPIMVGGAGSGSPGVPPNKGTTEEKKYWTKPVYPKGYFTDTSKVV
jgi:hypothetical protein